MRVACAETFHALVVYMHTRVRMDMFAALLPKQVVEILQPALWPAAESTEQLYAKSMPKKIKRLTSLTSLFSPLPSISSETEGDKTPDLFSLSLSLAAICSYADLTVLGRAILGLRDNVEHVGLREKALEDDIKLVYDVVLEALKLKSTFTEKEFEDLI